LSPPAQMGRDLAEGMIVVSRSNVPVFGKDDHDSITLPHVATRADS
jgi:hypothetical protein